MASDNGSIHNGQIFEAAEVHTALRRKLKSRHVAMIRYVSSVLPVPPLQLTRASSLGGVIGTGLFLGSATSLMNGGPLGILLGYLFVGTICFATMVSSCLHQSQAHIVLSLITAFSR